MKFFIGTNHSSETEFKTCMFCELDLWMRKRSIQQTTCFLKILLISRSEYSIDYVSLGVLEYCIIFKYIIVSVEACRHCWVLKNLFGSRVASCWPNIVLTHWPKPDPMLPLPKALPKALQHWVRLGPVRQNNIGPT